MKRLNARCQDQFVCFISSQKKAKQEQHLGWMNTWMHACHDTLLVWIAIFPPPANSIKGFPPSANSIDQNDTDPDVIWTRNLLIWSQTRYRCATRPADDRPIWCTSFPDPHSSSEQPICCVVGWLTIPNLVVPRGEHGLICGAFFIFSLNQDAHF